MLFPGGLMRVGGRHLRGSKVLPLLQRRLALAVGSSRFSRQVVVLLGVLAALLLLNLLFYLFGGISIEFVTDDPLPDLPSLWRGDAQPPPRGRQCAAWLAEVDPTGAGSEQRDWQRQPVVVAAGESRRVGGCAVGCLFTRSPPDHDACDAAVVAPPADAAAAAGGDEASSAAGGAGGAEAGGLGGQAVPGVAAEVGAACAYQVVWQRSAREAVVMPNASRVVAMTSSLSSDVPLGQPSWRDHAFMDPPTSKHASPPIVAILSHPCSSLQLKLDFIAEVSRQGVPVHPLGSCLPASDAHHATPLAAQQRLCGHRFALLFEELAPLHAMSPHFWAALACGTVPIVVAKGSIAMFAPADNAFLQVGRGDEVRQVVEWVGYLLRSQRAYSEMTRWKADVPSDTFLALLDLPIVSPHCRLCLHLATKHLVAWDESSTRKVCRCWDEATNTTLYHLYVRERGTFPFLSFFLNASELTMAHLMRAIYRLYHGLAYRPLWHGHRPDALSAGGATQVRVFRVYPLESSQEMVLHGSGAFRRDRQLQDYIEATPCPRLEVILV
ncbi:hypothetical protein CLOM_g17836 [Closterium sp. NIES-68]|nr:hypothetical protein CLOM_g17836 [Closterium sp. NIES-68]